MQGLGGLLLAGGRSVRFGSDKAHAIVDGTTLLDRAVACLREVCDGPVLVASGDGTSRPGVGDEQVADRIPDAGPLSALAAGLDALSSRCDRVAVLAVDHLAPSPQLLGLLDAQPGVWDVALAIVGGRRQPLHAIWSTAVGPALADAVDDGQRSVLRWLDGRGGVVEIAEQELLAAGIRPSATGDVDTPDDLPPTRRGHES